MLASQLCVKIIGAITKTSERTKLIAKAYFGPVHPIVVPKPPFNFNTTSLSKSFFISDRSTVFNKSVR